MSIEAEGGSSSSNSSQTFHEGFPKDQRERAKRERAREEARIYEQRQADQKRDETLLDRLIMPEAIGYAIAHNIKFVMELAGFSDNKFGYLSPDRQVGRVLKSLWDAVKFNAIALISPAIDAYQIAETVTPSIKRGVSRILKTTGSIVNHIAERVDPKKDTIPAGRIPVPA